LTGRPHLGQALGVGQVAGDGLAGELLAGDRRRAGPAARRFSTES
jgi:hypothetical protein